MSLNRASMGLLSRAARSMLLAPVALAVVVCVDASVPEDLIAQVAKVRREPLFEVGVGVGGGTGRFGGPGMAAVLRVGRQTKPFALGLEFAGVFRRELFAEGGAFFPDPGRTRTLARWAVSAVARVRTQSGTFGLAGLGVGTVSDIDKSVQDATPLKAVGAAVTTVGVGKHWRVGGMVITPRAELMLHVGGVVRVTGMAALAISVI